MKKIDAATREHLTIICYEAVLGEMIDQVTRNNAKAVVERFLNYEGYDISWVKCDQENNPPDLVDSNRMKIEICENTIQGSSTKIIHTIML